MFKIWNSLRKPLIISVSILLISLFGIYIFSSPRVTGDAASHLLLAVSPILKIGAPYRDFWDIKPPMMPLLLFAWSKIFGFGILSIRAINILLSALSVVLVYYLYKKIFKTPVFEIVFLSTILILLSPFLHSIMLPTEILGLVFSLFALLLLFLPKDKYAKYLFSGLFYFLASQSKEPFAFTIFAVIPTFAYSLLNEGIKKLLRNILLFMAGILVGAAAIYTYLNTIGSLISYKEVFLFKGSVYELTFDNLYRDFGIGIEAAGRTFTEFPLGFLTLIILSLLSLIIENKYSKKIIADKSRFAVNSLCLLNSSLVFKLGMIFYAIGSFVGFGLANAGLNNTFGSHYLIQVVVPFYIITGIYVSYLFDNTTYLFNKSRKRFWIVLAIFMFSIIIILPKRQYLKSYIPSTTKFVMADKVYDFEKRVTQITTNDQCILSVYGWGAGENYLYSRRRPCTRYFLPNIAVRDWQKKEYKRSIQEHPPAAIIYQTNGSDMNVGKFESEVINLSKIIKNCYKQDTEVSSVFVPKDSMSLKDCLLKNSN